MEKTQRILIVDDHTLFRAAVRALLIEDPAIEVVGEADNGRDAIRAVGELAPHLVLMDLTMPGMNGIEAITEIKRRYPDVRVLVMTLHDAEEYVHASLKAGADGYIVKGATWEELRVAIRSVLQGNTYLSTVVSANVVRAASWVAASLLAHPVSMYDSLTHRKREVRKFVADAHSNKYIAESQSERQDGRETPLEPKAA